ncbi:hypothetical protein BJ322DRAFT_1019815 [Thelephora terrestris]|uniref:Uncharacterized protein n=1 Tax=Thelephora terrestris TaxID=56493 RepID=A0A9P6HHL6_9AGAM|nr:hypothetical protein BJ322DRAFT_1019815 [Thelephora terrestris]
MSLSKYTLPCPVYLPSSGGYTSSRVISEPLHQRVFPFRRYSVEEDGRLVARTKNAGHTSPATLQSSSRDVSQASQEGSSRKQVDGATLSRLFQQLVPLMVDPPTFESRAAAICAAFDLDPTTSTEIIGSFKARLQADKAQGSILPVTSGPVGAPTPISIPVKHQRPFTSGLKGHTIWYTTESSLPLSSPPPSLPAISGTLYIHTDLSKDTKQTWLCNISCNWIEITTMENVKHPSIADRFLLLRSDGIPSWVTGANHAAIQSRKEKSGR